VAGLEILAEMLENARGPHPSSALNETLRRQNVMDKMDRSLGEIRSTLVNYQLLNGCTMHRVQRALIPFL